MPDDKPLINISNDHDLLIRIDTRIMDMLKENRDFKIGLSKKSDKEEFDKRCVLVDKKLADFESRTRRLERVAFIAIGIISVIQVLITIFLK